MVQTERTIRQAVSENQPIVLVVNKIDRLILELKLPPEDAYHKLQHTIESVNAIIEKCAFGRERLSPERGNVLFASAKYGFCFSLPSFAKKYADYHGGFPADQLAARLWGNRYFNESTRKFQSKADSEATQRSFVQFVLEPVYKIFSHVVSDEPKALAPILHSIGVRMSSTELSIDAAPLLRLVLFRFFGDSAAALTHALVEHVPSPAQAAKTKIETTYTGALNDTAGTAMLACDSRGPLRMQVIKQFPRPDASEFDAFARVFSGTIKVGDYVKVLGEAYSMEDEEDMAIKQVTRIWILEGRYRVEINQVKAGNWALFEGIDASITKTATVVSAMEDDASDLYIFRPLQFATRAVVKVAIEPLNPAELPKMLDGLRKLNKSYPLLSTKVEESGEHLILCTGELYADCVLHDLRRVYSDIEVKVADPVVSFCETVAETSSIWCFAQTPNQRNRLTMLAEPMPDGLAEDIESGNVRISAGPAAVASFFTDKYHWDALAARSVWAFGAQTQGPNVLVDDTLPHRTISFV
jgi:U5 small nuclear ribonucleoprotein component